MHLKGWLFVSLIAGTCLVLQIKNAKSQDYNYPYPDEPDGYIDPVPDIGPVASGDLGCGGCDTAVLENRIDNLENALQSMQLRMQEILSRQQPITTNNKCCDEIATLNRKITLGCSRRNVQYALCVTP